MERKGYSYLRSYWEVWQELESDADKVAFHEAICNMQFEGKETELKGIAKLAYVSQKHSIEKSLKGFLDVQKRKKIVIPSADPSQGGSVGASLDPSEQEKEKEKEEEQEKEQVKVKDINTRKAEFRNSLQPFLEKYGRDILNEFFYYWTEHNEKGRKMRFEMAKNQPFNISRRLVTWTKRNKTSNKQGLTAGQRAGWDD